MLTLRKITAYLSICLWMGCTEIPPTLNTDGGGGGGGSELSDQQKNVLMEEITGVRCVQCPAGSAVIEELIGQYGERLVAVSMHAAADFSPPYNESKYDFRTADGTALVNFLGVPNGFPSASIDRTLFSGEFQLMVGRDTWPGYVADQLTKSPAVKIGVEPTFTESNRNLKVDLTFLAEENVAENLNPRYTVLIVESGIQDYQLTPDGKISDYTHKHVLRKALTNFNGDPFSEALEAGKSQTASLTFSLPAEWKAEKCKLVVLVAVNGSTKEVLQVVEKAVL